MEESQPNLRRAAFIIIGCVLAVFLLHWAWHYYHTGKITITTNNRYSTISLSGVDENGQDIKPSFKGRGKLSVTVGTGKYVATVTGNSIATTQAINLTPHASLSYKINPVNATGVEPVAYENAQSMAVAAHQLVYFGSSSNDDDSSYMLYTVDDQNNLKEIDSDYVLQTVKWADTSFGVGQDNKGRLYTIAGTSVSPLKVPFLYGGKTVNFDVAANKEIYVSYGKDIYAGGRNGGFKKIYTATSSKPVLAAGPDQVAVADDRFGQSPSNIPKSLLATIYTSGKTSKKGVEAERLAWSPDGKYLATVNDSNPTIYDATLHKITVLSVGSTIGQMTWLDGNTLLYSTSGELWAYSLPAQKAQLVANMPTSASITGLYVSSDGAYIYVTTLDGNSEVNAIRRIGLKGQKVQDYIYKLQDILPLSLSSYSLRLVNFSGTPRILVQVPPYTGPKVTIQQAANKLQSLGFDTSKLQFEIESIEP